MKYSLLTIVLALTSPLVIAGSITDTFNTGEPLTSTNMNNIKDAVNDNNSNSPIAVGSIDSAGNVLRATPNVNSSADASGNILFYTISFNGEAYDIANFVTNVTPIAPAAVCNTSALNGNLQVACFDGNGNSINATFHFVTYKFF